MVMLLEYNQGGDDVSPWRILMNGDVSGLDMNGIANAVARVSLPEGWAGRPLSFVAACSIWGADVPDDLIQLG
jgi:hypothetical protein